MTKTHWKKLHNPDYLGAYSLDNGTGKYNDIIATVQSVKVEPVIGPDGKKEECTVMHFAERDIKPMVVNATNSKTLEKLFKTPYIEDWANRKIQIGVESVKAFGDVVDALRIRKFLPRETGTAKCADCKNDITAAGEMNATQVAAFSRQRFGCDLCAPCMKARDASKKAAEAAQEAPAETEQEAPDASNE